LILTFIKGIGANLSDLCQKRKNRMSKINMKKWMYRITTGLVSGVMLYTAASYFTAEEMKDSFKHLGFPDFFRVELGIAKALGALALLLPFLPSRLKEAAYAGFAITFVSAIVAHVSQNDPIIHSLQAAILLVLLGVSYFYFCENKEPERQ
jgi:hypothetical protein